MKRSLPVPSSPYQRRAAVAAVLLVWLCGCSNGRNDFIGARVKDSCNGSWPVCNQTASCFIGDQSYIQGRFPGQGKIIVRLDEPSDVKVSFFFDNISAASFSMTRWSAWIETST